MYYREKRIKKLILSREEKERTNHELGQGAEQDDRSHPSILPLIKTDLHLQLEHKELETGWQKCSHAVFSGDALKTQGHIHAEDEH